ncbi:MAG: FtsQ-type POTRA domain-containing protein [Eubacterium sp.]|nr:FtsQ-type POTRA domain-containing protein [Eubacterium sp.]MCM1215340.1 FtsQ-type POTRA domain-containing protein [Lachnospiraceae bacterium]MCM1303646.1 FtsQ-type POTRA domain-containing protein [Butyrivibrio sp.]MCM1343461.1 FtsQ-type POTRA domain-containing protein [Muribaculaceae bacterium]MCM1240956.1 FtsQ-type POTRA domain-containing protein [Lachnospiraceae bacterium]
MYRSRKKVIIIIVAVVFLAALAGAAYYIRENYTIHTVYVEGNVHYTEDEIKAIVMDGPLGDNSLYLAMKYENRAIEGIPFVDVMDVSILSPDTVKITVYEKAIIGYIQYLDACMYFDKDGYVVESSSVRTAGIPQITGLVFDYLVVGEALPVEDPAVFGSILNVTKLLNKYELDSDKIYFHASGEITLYFDDVKVALGNEPTYLEDKLMLLPEFLPNLAGKNGTLQMEKYDEDTGKYTFKPE